VAVHLHNTKLEHNIYNNKKEASNVKLTEIYYLKLNLTFSTNSLLPLLDKEMDDYWNKPDSMEDNNREEEQKEEEEEEEEAMEENNGEEERRGTKRSVKDRLGGRRMKLDR
jgi:hypothetical protein